MATLGKGTLYLSNEGTKSYSFIPSDYQVSDFVNQGPNVWTTIADNGSNMSFIATINGSTVSETTIKMTFSRTNEHAQVGNLFNPYQIDFTSDVEVSLRLSPYTSMYMDRRNSVEGQVIGDLLFEIFKGLERVEPAITLITTTDTYGNNIDYLSYTQAVGSTVTSSHLVFKDNQFDIEIEDTYTSSSSKYIFPTVASVYSCEVTTDVLKTKFNVSRGSGGQILNVQNVPEKPTWSGPYTDSTGKYWIINTNSRRKGNIYKDGEPEPLQAWTDGSAAPWSYKFYPQEAGAYTANTISSVPAAVRDVYSELSETLIVETETVNIDISFNEYTGVLTATAPTGSYSVYKLMKKAGGGYGQVGENTTGIFQITESGTYRVECDPKPLYQINPSEDITVETTLDTPNAYVEFSNPSQLGFDEVENANVYDIYRVSDDEEEDELVESVTVGVAARARSVKRAERIFRVVVKDDGYSL